MEAHNIELFHKLLNHFSKSEVASIIRKAVDNHKHNDYWLNVVNTPIENENEKYGRDIQLAYLLFYSLNKDEGIPLIELLMELLARDKISDQIKTNYYHSVINILDFLNANQILNIQKIRILQESIKHLEIIIEERKKISSILGDIINRYKNKSTRENASQLEDEFDTPKKLIQFNSLSTIDNIFEEMKGYFSKADELDLLKALKGEKLNSPIHFDGNQSQFSEVFLRMKYNNFISSTKIKIRDWICINFTCKKKQGQNESIAKFNKNSVWQSLTKKDFEPSKKIEYVNQNGYHIYTLTVENSN